MVDYLKRRFGCYIPKRHILSSLGFFGMFNLYAMRVNLSVAIVAMVNNTAGNAIRNVTPETDVCTTPEEERETEPPLIYPGEQYNWDEKTVGQVLGAFYYGFMITQIPGGFINERCGSKWLFGCGILATSALSLMTPVSASFGTSLLMAVFIARGLAEGLTVPALNSIISQWSPVMELSRMTTIVFIGVQVGNVISIPVSAWLCSSKYFGGWPSAFYLFGFLGFVWFVFWSSLICESPFEHPTISKEELALYGQRSVDKSRKKPPMPWKSVFQSVPMWGLLVGHFGFEFGFLIFFIELPNYLSSVHHFGIRQNGALSTLPFISNTLVGLSSSYVADKLRSSGKLSITSIRKIMNTVGFVGPGICLLCITVAGCRAETVVFLLTLGFALNGFTYSGFLVTHTDMSPNFTGTLYGVTNTVGNLSGVLGPAIVGFFTSDGVTMQGWNKVFYIASALYIGTAVFYVLFASAERQPWDNISTQEEKSKHSKSDKVIICSTRL